MVQIKTFFLSCALVISLNLVKMTSMKIGLLHFQTLYFDQHCSERAREVPEATLSRPGPRFNQFSHARPEN